MTKQRKGSEQSAGGAKAPEQKETAGQAGGDGAGGSRRRRPRTGGEVALDWARSLGAALLLFLVLRTFIVQTFVITSSSMEDTLLVGDFLILNKLSYGPLIPFTETHFPGYSHPKRHDVAVFRPPHDPGLDVVKRIIGMPGDTLSMTDKVLYINGVPQDEPYVHHTDTEGDVAHPWMRWQCGEPVHLSPDISGAYRVPEGTASEPGCHPTRDNWGPLVVPPAHYFMMGDNRDDSVDSRYWGFLAGWRLRGKADIIYYSYDPQHRRPFAFLRNVRPQRIGHVIH